MKSTPQPEAVRRPRRLACLAGLLGLAMLLPLSSMAQTAQTTPPAPSALQVQVWAASCMACHGPDGRAEGTGLRIAGMPAQEHLDKMLAFQKGTRSATIMHRHAKGYSEQELRLIAEYFSRIK